MAYLFREELEDRVYAYDAAAAVLDVDLSTPPEWLLETERGCI